MVSRSLRNERITSQNINQTCSIDSAVIIQSTTLVETQQPIQWLNSTCYYIVDAKAIP
jgi:hypothetical protein